MYQVMRMVSSGSLCIWWRYREAFPWGRGSMKCGFVFQHLYPCSAGVGNNMKWYQQRVAMILSFVSRNNSWHQKWKKFPCLFSLRGEFYTKAIDAKMIYKIIHLITSTCFGLSKGRQYHKTRVQEGLPTWDVRPLTPFVVLVDILL